MKLNKKLINMCVSVTPENIDICLSMMPVNDIANHYVCDKYVNI